MLSPSRTLPPPLSSRRLSQADGKNGRHGQIGLVPTIMQRLNQRIGSGSRTGRAADVARLTINGLAEKTPVPEMQAGVVDEGEQNSRRLEGLHRQKDLRCHY